MTRRLRLIRSPGKACLNPWRAKIDVQRQSPATLQATQALLSHTAAGKLTTHTSLCGASFTAPCHAGRIRNSGGDSNEQTRVR